MATRRDFVAWSLGALSFAAEASANERVRFAIVVAKSSPIEKLSFYDLKRAYSGEPINVAGTRLLPLNLPPASDGRVRFDRAVLGMEPEAVLRYWIDRKIRGYSGAPKSVGADLVQRIVARLEGGIGYVNVSELKSEVKVVHIDGKTPADSGYAIEG